MDAKRFRKTVLWSGSMVLAGALAWTLAFVGASEAKAGEDAKEVLITEIVVDFEDFGAVGPAVFASVDRMHAALRHRGPDSGGSWRAVVDDGATGVVLRARRSDVTDSSGPQPFSDDASGAAVAFEGAI